MLGPQGCDIMVFRGPASAGSGAASKNAVVMSNGVLDWERPETWTGMIDRSPCGALESQPDSPRRLEASLLHAVQPLLPRNSCQGGRCGVGQGRGHAR